MKPSYLPAGILIALVVFISPANAAVAVSDFNSGNEGWRVADLPQSLGNPPTVKQYWNVDWSSTGGNPFGYVHRQDPGDYWFWFAAPNKFLGNKSGTYGHSISFDLACSGNDGVNYAGMILVGTSYALYRQLPPPGVAFTHYEVPLGETGWHYGSVTGPAATAAQMNTVLRSLSALYINADWQAGFETTSLDNVVLMPEPGAIALLLAGGLLACSHARRRRRVVAIG